MLRRVQLSMALVGCVGALGLGGATAAASASVAHSRPVAIERVDVVAHPATAAATAKFLLHAGIAYYVFDHYIWKPFRAGDLHGFTHAFTIAKASLAAVFVYHEVKLMVTDVKASKLLSFLATPITAVVAKLESLKSDITGGHLNALTGVQSQLGSIKQQSNAKGAVITEITHSL